MQYVIEVSIKVRVPNLIDETSVEFEGFAEADSQAEAIIKVAQGLEREVRDRLAK